MNCVCAHKPAAPYVTSELSLDEPISADVTLDHLHAAGREHTHTNVIHMPGTCYENQFIRLVDFSKDVQIDTSLHITLNMASPVNTVGGMPDVSIMLRCICIEVKIFIHVQYRDLNCQRGF